MKTMSPQRWGRRRVVRMPRDSCSAAHQTPGAPATSVGANGRERTAAGQPPVPERGGKGRGAVRAANR
jgi:hypothetical protein